MVFPVRPLHHGAAPAGKQPDDLVHINPDLAVALLLALVKDQLHPEVRMSLAQAWDAEKEEILLSQAVGRIAGDFVNLYPPGIPVLVPGEQIEETHCRQLAEYLKEDLNVQGVTKDAGYRITVVKNE